MAETPIKTLKEGDKVEHNGEIITLNKVEFSNIGKHGKSKARLEGTTEKGEKKVIIRPADALINKQ